MTNKLKIRLIILASIQRALLGNITSNLRAVYVLCEDESDLHLIFYYDKPLSEDEEELTSIVDTEFMCDFPSPTYKTSYTIHVLPYPNRIPDHGICTFLRYEPKPDSVAMD